MWQKTTTIKKTEKEGAAVRRIGKIDIEKYRGISDKIRTDEVIVTDVQINHIWERHPEVFSSFMKYAPVIISDSDYILENRPNTGLLLKAIEDEGQKYQLVLQLCVSEDPKSYKNSIITFTRVRDKEWRRLLRNKKYFTKKNDSFIMKVE